MTTLLFPLKGPMQSWGVSSNFGVRDTLREPSKSGVLGLIMAALGLERDNDLAEFQGLRFGIRVEREGKVMVDFHTAKNVLNAGGSVLKNAVLSNRYFLADACFLAGLEGERTQLERIYQALQKPVWFLFLGRKSFPLTEPAWFPPELVPLQERSLEEALTEFPWLGATKRPGEQDIVQELTSKSGAFSLITTQKSHSGLTESKKLRLIIEDQQGYMSLPDQPLNYAQRIFSRRKMQGKFVNCPALWLMPREQSHVSD